MELKKVRTIRNIRKDGPNSKIITIPSIFALLLGLEIGDRIEIILDRDNKTMTLRKEAQNGSAS